MTRKLKPGKLSFYINGIRVIPCQGKAILVLPQGMTGEMLKSWYYFSKDDLKTRMQAAAL